MSVEINLNLKEMSVLLLNSKCLKMDRLPGVCVVYAVQTQQSCISTVPGRSDGLYNERGHKHGRKHERGNDARGERERTAGKLMQVSAERKEGWKRSHYERVFPGHERLAAPNWDYPAPLGSPSCEHRRQKARCRNTSKGTGTWAREDRKHLMPEHER